MTIYEIPLKRLHKVENRASLAHFQDGWIWMSYPSIPFWEAHMFTYLTARFGTPLLWEFQRFSWLGWGRDGMGNEGLGRPAPLLSCFTAPLSWLMLQDSFGAAVDAAGLLSGHIRCRIGTLWNHNCKKKTHCITSSSHLHSSQPEIKKKKLATSTWVLLSQEASFLASDLNVRKSPRRTEFKLARIRIFNYFCQMQKKY